MSATENANVAVARNAVARITNAAALEAESAEAATGPRCKCEPRGSFPSISAHAQISGVICVHIDLEFLLLELSAVF